MNLFIGDYKTFYKFFGGYARNKTRDLTQKYKSGVCACCGTKEKEIQSAHKRGFERSELVEKIFYESVLKKENENYYVDLDKFETNFTKFSEDISNFHFLCENCHRKYDRGEITDNDLPHENESIKHICSARIASPLVKTKKITKSEAKKLFLDDGYDIGPYYTFASECSNPQGIFWANPNINYLQHDWDIILNDSTNNRLHLFHIPAKTYTINDFSVRTDKPDIIQLYIDTGTFIESHKNVNFDKHRITTKKYNQD